MIALPTRSAPQVRPRDWVDARSRKIGRGRDVNWSVNLKEMQGPVDNDTVVTYLINRPVTPELYERI